MPPLPKVKLGVLADLERQLRFAPREALLRDAARAEQLAREIDPAARYPAEWLIFRITGYRADLPASSIPAGGEDPGVHLIEGKQVLADLSAFVERLTDSARLLRHEADALDPAGPAVTHAQLATQWKVSLKSLDRYRRQGLIARRVSSERPSPDADQPSRTGRTYLVYLPSSIEHFERLNTPALALAADFTRIDRAIERRILRRAERYARLLHCTLHQASVRLGDRFGRSHETIRQLLLRGGLAPAFEHRAPLRVREQRLAFRAWCRGLEPARIARHLVRPRPSVLRAINLQRSAQLTALFAGAQAAGDHVPAPAPNTPLPHEPETPLDAIPQLSHELAQHLPPAPAPTDLLEFTLVARDRVAPDPKAEFALAAAHRCLRERAAALVLHLDRDHPQAGTLDTIETLLRWSSRVKIELMRRHLTLLIDSIDSTVGEPAESLRSRTLRDLLQIGLAALSEAIDQFEPSPRPRGTHRLAAPAGLAIAKALAAHLRAERSPAPSNPRAGAAAMSDSLRDIPLRAKATTRLPTGVEFPLWTRRVDRWQAWLDLPHAVTPATLLRIAQPLAELLTRRHGLDGSRPRTLHELSLTLRINHPRLAVLERRALSAALAASRAARATPLPAHAPSTHTSPATA